MPANVEIKARVADIESLITRAKELSGEQGQEIRQSDTFFEAPKCRLKLRELQNQPSQLISYDRQDTSEPKRSDYVISQSNDTPNLKAALTKALPVKGAVKKVRMLYMVGQTRVHIDRVEGLGNFMELEVVLRDDQSSEEGQEIANDLMKKLDIQQEDLIQGAYLDLLLQKNKAQ